MTTMVVTSFTFIDICKIKKRFTSLRLERSTAGMKVKDKGKVRTLLRRLE